MIDVNYQDAKEIIKWLDSNIQENLNPNLERYTLSSVGRFVEWRSKDKESWIFRIEGMPPKAMVTIKDEKMRMLFMLRWS